MLSKNKTRVMSTLNMIWQTWDGGEPLPRSDRVDIAVICDLVENSPDSVIDNLIAKWTDASDQDLDEIVHE